MTLVNSKGRSRCVTFVKTYNGELTCLTSHRMQHRQSPQLLSVLLKTARPAWLERAGTKLMPDADMRDIRPDLQERGKFLEEQIGAAQTQFNSMFAQLQQEHKVKLDGLKKELDAVLAVIGFRGVKVRSLSFVCSIDTAVVTAPTINTGGCNASVSARGA